MLKQLYSQCTKTQLEPAIQSGIIFVYSIRPSDSHLWQNWMLKQAKTLKKTAKNPIFFSNKGSDSGETFCLHFQNLQKIWL